MLGTKDAQSIHMDLFSVIYPLYRDKHHIDNIYSMTVIIFAPTPKTFQKQLMLFPENSRND